VAQGIGPEFKLQYCKNKTKQKRSIIMLGFFFAIQKSIKEKVTSHFNEEIVTKVWITSF
jgi:hypothetical protein